MSPALVIGLMQQYGYIFIFFAAPFVGPLISLASGVLIRLEVLSLVPVYATLMASELTADMLWYWLGYHWGDPFVVRYGHYVGITEKRIEHTKAVYHRYHDSIIFIAKITAGFGVAPVIFFTAGLSRVPFRRYMLMNVLGQIIWTAAMLAIGYYLGHMYLSVNGWLGRVSYIALIAFVLAGLLGLSRYAYRRYTGDIPL